MSARVIEASEVEHIFSCALTGIWTTSLSLGGVCPALVLRAALGLCYGPAVACYVHYSCFSVGSLSSPCRGGGGVNYSPGIFSKDQFSWFTLPPWLAAGDSFMNKCFLRSIGVSPLVLRLSIGISTFPCVGWAIASPCITVRSLRATLSVQVLLRVEIFCDFAHDPVLVRVLEAPPS